MAYEPLDVTDFDKTNPFDVEKIRHLEGGIQANEQAIADVNADLTDLNKSISTETDCDDMTDFGFYYLSSATNTGGGSNGWLVVIPGQGNRVKQIWLRYGTLNTNDFNTYIRTQGSTSGNWSDWQRFAMESELNSDFAEVQSGTIASTSLGSCAANTCTTYQVTFATAFSGIPTVAATLRSTTTNTDIGKLALSVVSESTTGFQLRVYNGSDSSYSPGIAWIAVLPASGTQQLSEIQQLNVEPLD